MRFPFFATNRQFDKESAYCFEVFEHHCRCISLVEQDLCNLKQQVLVLEGEINKLKGDEKRGRQKKGN